MSGCIMSMMMCGCMDMSMRMHRARRLLCLPERK